MLLSVSELGGDVMYRGVVSKGGCFQSFGGLLPLVGTGSFWPYRVCALTCGGSLSPWAESYNCSVDVLQWVQGAAVGQRWKMRVYALHLCLLICQPQGLRSYKVRMLCPGLFMHSLFVTILVSAHVSIIPLQGLGTLPPAFLPLLRSSFYLMYGLICSNNIGVDP